MAFINHFRIEWGHWHIHIGLYWALNTKKIRANVSNWSSLFRLTFIILNCSYLGTVKYSALFSFYYTLREKQHGQFNQFIQATYFSETTYRDLPNDARNIKIDQFQLIEKKNAILKWKKCIEMNRLFVYSMSIAIYFYRHTKRSKGWMLEMKT